LELMYKLGSIRDAKIIASREWIVDQFIQGPPPIAVELLSQKGTGRFYEKLVKLLDVQKSLDARVVLVVSVAAVGPDEVRLASNFGIYVVAEGDENSLRTALSGGDLEINREVMERLVARKSKKLADGCRKALLDLMQKRWFTTPELYEQLRWRYKPKTIDAQLLTLRRQRAIAVLARTLRGEGIYGIKGKTYLVREDLSHPSRISYIRGAVVEVMKEKDHPMSYDQITNALGVKKHEVTAVLRELARKGKVTKTDVGWALN